MIIDPVLRRAYVMSPEGGIDALDIFKGQRVWSTKAAAKPLGVVGQKLVSQAEGSDSPNNMRVALLDTATGNLATSRSVALPNQVQASVVETLRGEFNAIAQNAGDDAIVSWEFRECPIRRARRRTQSTPRSGHLGNYLTRCSLYIVLGCLMGLFERGFIPA